MQALFANRQCCRADRKGQEGHVADNSPIELPLADAAPSRSLGPQSRSKSC